HVERAAPRLRARPRRWGRAPLLPREPQRAAAVARQCDVAVLQRAARERVRRLEALLVATREKELPDAADQLRPGDGEPPVLRRERDGPHDLRRRIRDGDRRRRRLSVGAEPPRGEPVAGADLVLDRDEDGTAV